ncbi:MAG: hypothetical protein HZA13_04600 [Nitrospirae bacterium]|nr:hypothetical protein [Nitrospirota bacterium]
MPLPEITEEIIRNLSNDSSYWKGMNYYDDGNLKRLWTEVDKYIAHVQGYELYTVMIWQEGEKIKTSCTCPYDFGGICKHTVTTMIAINRGEEVEREEKAFNEIRVMLNNLPGERAKEFLFDLLRKEQKLRDDFRIFAKGEEETDKRVEDYKGEIHKLFGGLREKHHYYHDSYYDREDHSPVDEIINKFIETAEIYSKQKNYKEAIKIHRAIYESCHEALNDERLEDFHDDISYEIEPALKRIAENIGKLEMSLKEKKAYLDYLVESYKADKDWGAEVFEHVFRECIKTPEEAGYILNKTASIPLDPLIKFNLLLIKGDLDEIIAFGEAKSSEQPEITLNLSSIYLKQGLKDKAIETAEKGVSLFDNGDERFPLGFSHRDQKILLRKLLDCLYDREMVPGKVIENILNLLHLEKEIEYYHRLKELLKTDKERADLIIKLEGILKEQPEMLFKIYSIEEDHERLLILARKSLDYDLFHPIVNKIKEKYPDECFELYKKKINKYLENASKRNVYQQASYWLKLMKQIPENAEKFKRYIDHIRMKYKRRHALMDELKDI